MARPAKKAAQDADITPDQAGELMDMIAVAQEKSAALLARLEQFGERVRAMAPAA